MTIQSVVSALTTSIINALFMTTTVSLRGVLTGMESEKFSNFQGDTSTYLHLLNTNNSTTMAPTSKHLAPYNDYGNQVIIVGVICGTTVVYLLIQYIRYCHSSPSPKALIIPSAEVDLPSENFQRTSAIDILSARFHQPNAPRLSFAEPMIRSEVMLTIDTRDPPAVTEIREAAIVELFQNARRESEPSRNVLAESRICSQEEISRFSIITESISC
jgi:hypothetical protein